ncbi:MAG TPA: DNA-processing protein DprA [Treponemataceae bacterium]|nr:DNA-processing protein DprA [Treponemataceae bacterium]
MKEQKINNYEKRQDSYAYFLHNMVGIGNKSIASLLSGGHTPIEVYHFSEKQVKQILGSQRLANSFCKAKDEWNVEKEYQSLLAKNITFYHREHPQFPVKLKEIPNPPYGIYVKGTLPEEHKPAIAIIGARLCSDYGRYMARQFGMFLAAAGVPVISGLASGIDGISQKAAIEAGGKTYGVLGCGVDICYPQENRAIYNEMDKRGGIISEFIPGTLPKPGHFPMRNRIISGLADLILVIEAKEKSGTLITVDMALEQGREVFALPGRVTDAVSSGCNNLIRQGAGIALSPQQLLQELQSYRQAYKINFKSGDTKSGYIGNEYIENKPRLPLMTKEELLIYEHLDLTKKSIDEILKELPESCSVPIVMDILVALVMKGIVKSHGTHYFAKTLK